MAGEQQDSLCQRCQSIDFEAFWPEDVSPELFRSSMILVSLVHISALLDLAFDPLLEVILYLG